MNERENKIVSILSIFFSSAALMALDKILSSYLGKYVRRKAWHGIQMENML